MRPQLQLAILWRSSSHHRTLRARPSFACLLHARRSLRLTRMTCNPRHLPWCVSVALATIPDYLNFVQQIGPFQTAVQSVLGTPGALREPVAQVFSACRRDCTKSQNPLGNFTSRNRTIQNCENFVQFFLHDVLSGASACAGGLDTVGINIFNLHNEFFFLARTDQEEFSAQQGTWQHSFASIII